MGGPTPPPPPPNNFLATKVKCLLGILVANVSSPKVESVPTPLYCVHINESDFKRSSRLAQLIRYFEILCTLQMSHLYEAYHTQWFHEQH